MQQEVENTGVAPVIPAGTEPTVYGEASYKGQAPQVPTDVEAQGNNPTNPTNAPSGTTFEELAAKKGFKSPDDLAKSYAELEKQRTKQSMDIAELVKARGEDQAQSQLVQQVQNDNPDMSHDEAIKIVQNMISKEVRPLREELEILRTFKTEEDMKLAPEAAKIVKENPGLSWKLAYELAKSRISNEREQGTSEAYDNFHKKQSAQVDTVSTGIRKEVNLEDIVNNKNLPFSEVQKIFKQKFNQ